MHPFQFGQTFSSPGGHFLYRVIGPCCPLFDREQLPWPCCRLQWRGKEPSWRRVGRRFIPDLASRKHPSYCVEMLSQGVSEPMVITLYSVNLPHPLKTWWIADQLKDQAIALEACIVTHPIPATRPSGSAGP